MTSELPDQDPEITERGLPPGARGRRLAAEPRVSVVVASQGDRAMLARCLAGLLTQCAAQQVEIVVARSCEVAEYRELEQAYPAVLFMPAATGSTLQELRWAGTSAAEGDVVFLTDDAGDVPPDFVASRLRAWRREPESAEAPAVDWPAYFARHGVS